MHKRVLIILISCVLWSSGCAHLPIKTVSRDETRAFLDGFQSKLGGKYEVLNSVLFRYRFFSFSSLGLTSIDEPKDYLAVAGMTPAGMTLFQIVAEKGVVTRSFVVPEFAKRGDVAKAVSGSIRDIYFDLTPSSFLSMVSKGDKFYLRMAIEEGIQKEYIFSMNDQMLLEKRFYKKGKLFWNISYGNWFSDSVGKIHPRSIHFLHRAYNYQLFINAKEVRPL